MEGASRIRAFICIGGTALKRSHVYLSIISIVLLLSLSISLASCATKVKAENLMEGITPNDVTPLNSLDSKNEKVTDFAVRLFKASEKKNENTLISPLSVLSALSMTANGAKGETKSQMEAVLGMPVDDLNSYLYTYMKKLPQGDKYKLALANSIWFTEDSRFTPNTDFLQTNADYYGADVYKAPFNNQTCKDINNWVKNNTDGMIEEILDEIPEEAVMYLVNALAFEAEWAEIYEKGQVRDGEFTKENGEKQKVKFMYSEEGKYLESHSAKGFVKYYKGGKYAFVAMLPNEGVTVSDYVASLDGESLNSLLSKPQNAIVLASIPKFETEFSCNMNEILINMGMKNAFDGDLADFSDLGSSTAGNIFIGRVLHKTFISVAEKGTKAGAATVVEMNDEASIEIEKPKQVYLDRPFVYMLVDCENNIPFFIGTLMTVE